MSRINLSQIRKKILGFSLLILFCGYFGSITFFPHTHIVDGNTIVHSHPYKSQPANNPVNHDHSKNGLRLIQFITNLIATASILFCGVAIIRNILNIRLPGQDENLNLNFNLFRACLPRAPTL